MLGTLLEGIVGAVLIVIPEPATTIIGACMVADSCRRVANKY